MTALDLEAVGRYYLMPPREPCWVTLLLPTLPIGTEVLINFDGFIRKMIRMIRIKIQEDKGQLRSKIIFLKASLL